MPLFGKRKSTSKSAVEPKDKPARSGDVGGGLIMPGSGRKEERPRSKKVKGRKLKADTKQAYRVLQRPIISEKGSFLATGNTYLFQVAKGADKAEIARAVYSVYGVRPVRVRVINMGGKQRRYRNVSGRTAAWKKAMVTLPAGKKIDLHEGV